jgi:HlyD family secretion protein
MKRTLLYVVVGVVILAVVGVVLWQTLGSAADQQEQVQTASVTRETLLVTVTASGRIEPAKRVGLTFGISGRVDDVLVEVGDAVAAGDVLARLDSEQLMLQVEQAEAALDSAAARLAQLQAGPRPEEVAAAEAELEAAEARLSTAVANRDQVLGGATEAQIAAAEAELASAKAQQRSAEEFHDKTMTCVDVRLPTGEKRTICPALGPTEEKARYNLEIADRQLEAAQIRYDDLAKGADEDAVRSARASVWAAAAQRDAAQARLDLLTSGPTQGQLAASEAQVAQARATLEQAQLALDSAELRAPFDAVVADVAVNAGTLPPAGPAVTLIDPSSFQITVGVDELDIGRLVVGQPAEVTLDAFPDRSFAGTVQRIDPAATLDGGVVTYDVVVGLGQTDAPVRTDMTANVTISIQELADVLTIPTWVVRVDRLSGQTYVDRQTPEGLERADVVLGVRYQGLVQVRSGLDEGDEVVWVSNGDAFGFGPQ